MEDRKYKFSWDLIGDIEYGRPNLGSYTRVEVYRLMQFTFRDILEQTLGSDKTDKVFFDAGKLAGSEFYKQNLSQAQELSSFINDLKDLMIELGIGIIRIEHLDLDKGDLTLTLAEDLDCSGLPEINEEVCTYDEGFIAGILEGFFQKPFEVKEVDCWCTGDRTCRFDAKLVEIKSE